MAVSLLVAILLLQVGAHCRPSFIETDSIVFPDSDNSTSTDFSEKLKECIRDNFKIEFNGECRALYTTDGVCPEGQWLVLDLAYASLPRPKIRGKCVVRRCPPKKHFWVEQKRCVFSNESVTLCPKGNKIDTDNFGDGFCECRKDPIHVRDRTGACHPVYTKGPCLEDRFWLPVNGKVECRRDGCTLMRSQLPNKIIVPWNDRKCYVMNEQGPCKSGLVVRVNMFSYVPECADPLTPLNLIPPPCTGFDHLNRCTRPTNTVENTYYTQVISQANQKRPRKNDTPK